MLLCPWDSPGKNTGVGHQTLLQGIFPTQGLNEFPASPTLVSDSLQLSHQERPLTSCCCCCCCCWVASVLSDPVQPHRQQPTRLPRPWDSPGKNTGVGCHFLLQCMKVKCESKVTQSCPTLCDPWTAAYQAPLSMGFSRQEHWSGVPLPSPSDILDQQKYSRV